MSDLASLVIGLRADVATLQSDLGKATALNQRYAQNASDAWTKGAADAAKAMGAALVSFTGIAIALGKNAIDAADNFNKMSQKVGISVESLSALTVQAKLSDVSIDQLQGGLAKLARNAADTAGGNKQAAAGFRAIGVSVQDASGNLKPMESILGDVATRLASYRDGTGKTAIAQQLLGKSGADLIPLLNELGIKGFEAVRIEAAKYGQTITGATSKASEDFNDNLTKLKLEMEGFANAVVAQVLPSLNKLTDRMVDAGQTTSRYGESASTLVNIVKGVTFAFLALGESIRAVVNIAAASGDTLIEIMSLPAKAGMALADGGLDAAKKSIADSLGGIRNAWASASTGVGDAIDGIKTDFNDLFGTFANVSSGAKTTAGAVELINPPLVKNADAAKKSASSNVALKNSLDDLDKSLKALSGTFGRVNSLNQSFTDQIATIAAKMRGADEAQIQYEKNLKDIADIQKEFQQQGMSVAESIMATGEATANANRLLEDTRGWEAQQKAAELMREEIAKSQQMWGDFADAVFDAVTQSGNFLKNLLNNLKSIVTQMLKEWFRTRVIGSFSGSGVSMASLGAASVGSTGGGWSIADIAALASGQTSNATFGTGQTGSLSILDAGKKLWDGFSSGMSTIWNGSATGYSSNMFGSATNLGTWGGNVYQPTAFGSALGIAGGLYAGYNRYQQAGGGFGGIVGGAAYGLGTITAAGALGGIATGAGAAAGAAGGLSAVGLGAIPVVGWIALAAMLIDQFSGGKLFGTKGEVKSGVSTLSVDAAGANYSTFLALKGQSALFGGAKWSTQNVPQTPEEAAAAKAFYDSMVNTMGQYADEFGVKAGDLVSAQFGQQFDKHGNPTGVTSATIDGYTYQNLKPEEFQQAYIAANQIEVLTQFDSKLKETIETYRQSAAQLVSVASGLSTAEGYFQSGGEFIGIAGEQTLSAVVTLAEGMTRAGEAIGDTINRLVQAQAQYDQFVGQFKPATNYVDDFEAAMSGIRDQLLANIKTANDLAKAAGAAGASEKDLSNIHAYAAKQAAQALQALQASSQDLAFSLGLTTIGSLDAVNAEIAALQGKANSGASAVHSFGNAMQDAAQRATDAMNLLLGNLSPLNDQQKLQTALSGLHAGTVSVDQVLEIGRRLYASSQAYTDLFNSVKGFASRGMGGLSGAGGGASGASSGGLTGAERERLTALLAQQSNLQAAQQLQQYQTLAQQIAERASAEGIGWREVIAEMGVNLSDFEAGLQKTDAQTDAYIKGQQALLDDNGENTQTIVGVLNKILTALGGTPDTTDPQAPNSGQGLPQQIGTAVETSFNRSLDRSHSMHPRSARPQAPA